MATIILEDVPDSVVKAYGHKIRFSYDISFREEIDADFHELDDSEVAPELIKKIDEAKQVPKHLLCNI